MFDHVTQWAGQATYAYASLREDKFARGYHSSLDAMGCDGGTIPRRDEMVKLKKKAQKVSSDCLTALPGRHTKVWLSCPY